MIDAWKPEQYELFKDERRQPFDDLVAGLTPTPGGRAIDFGCGSGALTAHLADHLGLHEVVGVDNSQAMLAPTAAVADPRLRFVPGDMIDYTPAQPVDLVFANASLHWVPDHAAVLARWRTFLAPGGQLAVQIPANHDHASHRVAVEIANELPFRSAFGPGGPPADPVAAHVLAPEAYAELLHRLGFARPSVQLRVYGHQLTDTDAVAQWTQGTSLTRFSSRLDPETFARFLAAYRARLRQHLGAQAPYFFTFKRILMWARLS